VPPAAVELLTPKEAAELLKVSASWLTPAQRIRKTCPATSQEAWPEAESLAMKDSLGREPRWNADRCAPLRRGARPWPMPRQKSLASVGVSPPTFAFVPFVIASSTQWSEAIHAEVSLAQRFHRRSQAAAQHGPPASASEGRRSANGYVRS